MTTEKDVWFLVCEDKFGAFFVVRAERETLPKCVVVSADFPTKDAAEADARAREQTGGPVQ